MAFEYLERFEDGDASDWSNLTASNLSNLSGSWLGEVTSSNAIVTATSPSLGDLQDPFYFEVEIPSKTSSVSDSVEYEARDASAGVLFRLLHGDNGDLSLNGTVIDTWAAGTSYEYRANIDYTADEMDLIRNGTTIATNVALIDTGTTGVDILEIANKTDTSGESRSAYVDDLAYVQPPNTPQNFAAVQGANAGEVDTSWDDVAQETSYNLYRTESSPVSTSDTLVAEPTQDTTAYTDTGLEDGEQFFYAVSAEDEEGESGLSNEDGAITILPQTNFDSVSNA